MHLLSKPSLQPLVEARGAVGRPPKLPRSLHWSPPPSPAPPLLSAAARVSLCYSFKNTTIWLRSTTVVIVTTPPDACVPVHNCSVCVASPECGWCAAANQCMRGDVLGPLKGWRACADYDYCSCHLRDGGAVCRQVVLSVYLLILAGALALCFGGYPFHRCAAEGSRGARVPISPTSDCLPRGVFSWTRFFRFFFG